MLPIIFAILMSFSSQALTFRCEERAGVNGRIPLVNSRILIKTDAPINFKDIQLQAQADDKEKFQIGFRDGVYWDSRSGAIDFDREISQFNKFLKELNQNFKNWPIKEVEAQILFTQNIFSGALEFSPLVVPGKQIPKSTQFAFRKPHWFIDRKTNLPKNSFEYRMGPRYVVFSEAYGIPFKLLVEVKSAYWAKNINCFRINDNSVFKLERPENLKTLKLSQLFLQSIFDGLLQLKMKDTPLTPQAIQYLKKIALDLAAKKEHLNSILTDFTPTYNINDQKLQEAIDEFSSLLP